MTGLRTTLLHWIDQQLDEMLAAPRMWGSPEAVEAQALLLFELRALVLRPAVESEDPRRVLEWYAAQLRARYPAAPPQPLFRLTAPDETAADLARVLGELRRELSQQLREENPFQHSELALRLVFKPATVPPTSALTGYYEEFRRAARAVARPPGKNTGRAPKAVEVASDFVLEDARITPRNGAPAEALLLLGLAGGLRDPLAEAQVRDALTSIVTMAEWAESAAPVTDLALDDVEQRTRLAVQMLRLLPGPLVATVGIGGRWIGRSKPVELRPAQEARFLNVVSEGSPPEPFDATDEVRALDLDRGLVVLGRTARMPCYLRPERMVELRAVGIRARVVGQRYRTAVGRPFVLADTIEPLEGADAGDGADGLLG